MEVEISKHVKLESRTEFPAVQFNQPSKLVVDLTLTAPTFTLSEERAAVNLVAVVDTSGSMSGAKINLVQDSLEFCFGPTPKKGSILSGRL